MKNLFLLLVVLLLTACQNPGESRTTTLVTFKDGSLSDQDLQAHYQKMRKDPMFRDKPELLSAEAVFDHALNMEMIIALGLEKKLHLDPRVREEIHAHMSRLFLKLLQDELITKIDRAGVTDAEAEAYYNEHQDKYRKNEVYRLWAFSVDRRQADMIARSIRAGECSFAAAAHQYAQAEQERESGGFTGARSLERFKPEWRKQVAQLNVGEIYGPLELDGEARLLWLESKSEPYQYGFEEKKEYVRNDLLYQRYREAWQAAYDDLREQFGVKINEKALAGFYRSFNDINAGGEAE